MTLEQLENQVEKSDLFPKISDKSKEFYIKEVMKFQLDKIIYFYELTEQ